MSGPRPIVTNQSSLKDFNTCQRLYGWKRLHHLEPVDRRSAPEIGTAVHAGLAVLHTRGEVESTIEDAVSVATTKLRERTGPGSSFADKSLGEAQEVVEKMLPAYMEHWKEKGELWAPLNQEVEFCVEIQPGWWDRTFSADVTDEEGAKLEAEWEQNPSGVWLRGRADNLSILKGGALYLVDYKTAGRMDVRDLLKYEMDFQITAYIYGISKQLTADSIAAGGGPIKVEGAIIDLLVKTAVPQFAREDFSRSETEMREFELEFIEYGQRIRAQHDRVRAGEDWKVVFPKNTESCFKYGTCAFRDLCVKDTPTRRQILDTRKDDYVDEAQKRLEDEWTRG